MTVDFGLAFYVQTRSNGVQPSTHHPAMVVFEGFFLKLLSQGKYISAGLKMGWHNSFPLLWFIRRLSLTKKIRFGVSVTWRYPR
jgi:hypothetical protein